MADSIAVHGLLSKYKKLDSTYNLYSPTPTERGELEVMKQINGYIYAIGGPITVKVGKHTFKNVYGANKIEGTPKADIALVCYDDNKKKFVNQCFISHKMGNSAAGFQQYSGITSKADGAAPGSISKDKNVVLFLESISSIHKSIVDQKLRYYREIKDKKLIGKSVYGPKFGASKFDEDNIHLIGQGDAVLRKVGNIHQLNFFKMSLNPDVSEFQSSDYTAIIGARYSSGRNYEVKGKTYSGVRVLIMPKKLIGSKAIEI